MLALRSLANQGRSIWPVAAVGAFAIHLAGIALALSRTQPDAAIELGAPAIAIGIELESPRLETSDLPVGPDTAAAAATPANVEQKAALKQHDLPRAQPTETDDPDRAVTPNERKKPREDPKVEAVQAAPSAPSVAAEETAVPTVAAAIQAPRSTAPALGTGESARRERQTWQKELAAHFNKYKRYPEERARQRAEVVVRFVLDRVGKVLSTRIVHGSGDAAFDDAALGMLQRADPVPPPPPLVADEGLTFTMPVIFYVKGDEADASDHKPK